MDDLADLAKQYRASRDRTDELHAQLRSAVRAARAGGRSVLDIAREIGMDRETVYRYLRD